MDKESFEKRKKVINDLIHDKFYTPMKAKEIAMLLNIPKEDRPDLQKVLDALVLEGKIGISKKGKYGRAENTAIVGKFISHPKGFGFVEIEGEEDDVFISEKDINGALHNDVVQIVITQEKRGDKRKEGKILRVIERGTHDIVGIYRNSGKFGFVEPDNQRFQKDIFVPGNQSLGAVNGHKVVVRITDFGDEKRKPEGHVIKIIGHINDPGTDIMSIVEGYEIPTEYPDAVMDQLYDIPNEVDTRDMAGRKDIRDWVTVTIDGEDAKDLDDAITITKNGDKYILGVHIADVSHYVTEYSALDKEAKERGTSVYLVDRVIPMLPHKLSNGICSLNEGVLRLAMSVFITFDNDGNIVNQKFNKSYIKSTARMTYNEVYRIIEEKPQDLREKYSHIVPMIEDMYDLYLLLAEKTDERGSIDFNIPEAKAVFDKNGKTVDIVLRESNFAHKIIEEFMVAANSTVAKYLSEKGIGALYRVHDEPNKEKLENTLNFIYNKGYGHSSDLRDIIAEVKGTEQEAAFSTMLLRSMAKAKYSHNNDGHYGLMLENYCHFTSPIRRYPDLVCHRALKAIIEKDEKTKSYLNKFVSEAGEQCSERENAAAMCERDTLDIKKAEYMEAFVGQDFEGVISSITGFGFFVMLPNTVEGLVRLESLNDDYYVFDQKNLTLYGERTGRTFTIGNCVKVKLVQASKISRRIDFKLLEGGEFYGRKRTKTNGSPKQKRSSRVLHRRKVRGGH